MIDPALLLSQIEKVKGREREKKKGEEENSNVGTEKRGLSLFRIKKRKWGSENEALGVIKRGNQGRFGKVAKSRSIFRHVIAFSVTDSECICHDPMHGGSLNL